MSNILEKYFSSYEDSEMYYNRLDYRNFNIEEMNKKYQIVGLQYRGGKDYINFESTVFEELAEKEKILSVSFAGGSIVYILLERDSEFLWDEFFKDEKYEDFSKVDVYIKESYKNIDEEKWKIDLAFNLLLNALAETGKDSSNLNGQLYIYAGRAKKLKEQIIMMNYFVKNGLLIREQQSFVPVKYSRKKDKEVKSNSQVKSGKEVKRYIIKRGKNNSRILIKHYRGTELKEGEKVYIKKSESRHLMRYDHLTCDEKHKLSRTDLLHDLIYDFDYKYKGIAKIEFDKVPVKTTDLEKYFDDDVKNKKMEEYRSLGTINMVTADDVDCDSEKLSLIHQIMENAGLDVKVSDSLNKEQVNITVIHDKDYYKNSKEDDIKFKIPEDVITQSITVENIEKSSEMELDSIVKRVLSELVIKNGLKYKKIKDWEFGNCEIYLGIRNKKAIKKPVHCLMKIDYNGYFEIIDDPNLIGSEFTKYINSKRFVKRNGEYKNGSVCIVKKDGNINEIAHTDYVPIIDKELKEELDSLSNKRRTLKKEYRMDKRVYPHIGKSIMMLDGLIHYTIGLDSSPKPNVKSSNNIYKVEPLKDENDVVTEFIPEIIDMLKDYHVRSDSTESVRPYPFKYLIEHIRINNPGVEISIV